MFYHGQIIGRTVAAAATASMQGKPWKQFKSNLRWIHFVCSFLLSSHSPSAVPFVIRYIWIVHTSCDNKISCPFKHCATHITHIYVVKWMFGMLNQWQLCLHAISECFYMLVGFFMLFFFHFAFSYLSLRFLFHICIRFAVRFARSKYKQLEAFRSKNTFHTQFTSIASRFYPVGMDSSASRTYKYI